MTLKEIRDLVRRLLFEKITDEGLGDAPTYRDFINRAWESVYGHVAALDSGYFAARATVSFPSGEESVDLPQAVGRNVVTLIEDITDTSDDPPVVRLVARAQLARSVYVDEPGYALDGMKLFRRPEPSETRTLQITYIPPPRLLRNDGDSPNLPPQHHRVIAVEAAYLMAMRDGTGRVILQLDEIRRRWTAELDNELQQRQVQEPWGVVSVEEIP